MHTSPTFASGHLVLFVDRMYVKPSPRSLLPLPGECSHCCSRLREFKDPQCSERRCGAVSVCSQKQPGHSLFETCDSGRGRWVVLAPGSSSLRWPCKHTQLTCMKLKYQLDVDKITLGWLKRQKKGKERKVEWETGSLSIAGWWWKSHWLWLLWLWWEICLSRDSKICLPIFPLDWSFLRGQFVSCLEGLTRTVMGYTLWLVDWTSRKLMALETGCKEPGWSQLQLQMVQLYVCVPSISLWFSIWTGWFFT